MQNTLKNLYESKGFSSEFLLSKELISTTLDLYKGNLELYLQNIKRIVNSLTAKDIILPNRFSSKKYSFIFITFYTIINTISIIKRLNILLFFIVIFF